jgi:sugar transferase (PEP-CTERM system associated)
MIKISNHYVSKIVFVLLIAEIVILVAASYLGISLRARFLGQFETASDLEEFLPSTITFAIAMVMGMSALGMYQRNLSEDVRSTFLRLMPASVIGLVLLLIAFYVVPALYLGRGFLLTIFMLAATGILLVRGAFFALTKSRVLLPKIIFLGAGQLVKECIETARNNIAHRKYEIVGAIPVLDEECLMPKSIIHAKSSLLVTANFYDVKEIVVAISDRRGGNLRIEELLDCKLHGINVIDAATFFEREACQIRLDCLQPSWLVFGSGFEQGLVRTFFKRVFDLSICLLILPLLIPIMLIAALCIFIEDRAPVFYRQERVGKNGQTFMVLKFRSMRRNAEAAGTPQWATANDPRVTRVGSILRKFRIDELPQVLNVFKGEMSFVGPRPERPYFVDQLNKEILFYNLRHSIKPGITGWAQVRYQYGSSVDDAIQKLQYDLYYVKNNSLFLDILILIDTLRVVLFGSGT